MGNRTPSELLPKAPLGSRLLRMALAGMMSFAAIAGFAANASAQSDTGDATIDATLESSITLAITNGAVAFGTINPATDPAVGTRVADENVGAYFVSPAVTITVNSNAAWSGTAERADGVGAIDTTGLIYLNETTQPTAVGDFTTTVGPTGTPTNWESTGALGSTVGTHYLSLFVPWTQAPGTVAVTVTYTVAVNP